jgi:hypothetical protein
MNTNTDINELKANGEYFAAGALAALQGRANYYVGHFGMRASLEFARSEFSKGWHSVAIDQMKIWCLANYESGADTMIECWGDADYQKLLDDCDGSLSDALSVLKGIAGAYADQQADARYHADGSAWAAAAGDAK